MLKRSFCEEAAREFRFSMACSSTRDFGAESALNQPPPPAGCAPTSKECRMAALAYAPCLPPADRLVAEKNIRSNLEVIRGLRKTPTPDSHRTAVEPPSSD